MESENIKEMSRTASMLEAVNLTKRYDDGVLALDNLNLSVFQGRTYAMLGANGAGKTTTINLFLNFIDPTEGEARVAGIASHRDPLLIREKVSYVSENVMLYMNFSAVQNLDFFARLAGKSKGCGRDECREVLRRVGLEDDCHDRKLRTFSKGMRQKCGIAIAVIKGAPAILLDEPTSGLDPKAAFEFINLLDSLRAEGRAILMSTHDIFRAREIADDIGIMKEGRLVMQRSRKELEGEDLEKIYLDYMSGLS